MMSSSNPAPKTSICAKSSRLAQAGLRLHPNKCNLFRTELVYLGHLISRRGVEPDPAKLAGLDDLVRRTPRTAQQAMAILGTLGYYRQFIPNFTLIAAPSTT